MGVATCKFSDFGLLPAEGWAKKMPKRWGMRGGWGVYGVPFFTICLVYQMSSGRSSHLCQHTIYGNTLAEVHEGIGNCPATEPCPFGGPMLAGLACWLFGLGKKDGVEEKQQMTKPQNLRCFHRVMVGDRSMIFSLAICPKRSTP